MIKTNKLTRVLVVLLALSLVVGLSFLLGNMNKAGAATTVVEAWVDGTNGDDATGALGSADTAFHSLEGALVALKTECANYSSTEVEAVVHVVSDAYTLSAYDPAGAATQGNNNNFDANKQVKGSNNTLVNITIVGTPVDGVNPTLSVPLYNTANSAFYVNNNFILENVTIKMPRFDPRLFMKGMRFTVNQGAKVTDNTGKENATILAQGAITTSNTGSATRYITINDGTFAAILSGPSRYGTSGTAYLNATITIGGGTVTTVGFTNYAGSGYTGAGCNVTYNINGGKITNLMTGQTHVNTSGTKTFSGKSTINMTDGEVTNFYGHGGLDQNGTATLHTTYADDVTINVTGGKITSFCGVKGVSAAGTTVSGKTDITISGDTEIGVFNGPYNVTLTGEYNVTFSDNVKLTGTISNYDDTGATSFVGLRASVLSAEGAVNYTFNGGDFSNGSVLFGTLGNNVRSGVVTANINGGTFANVYLGHRQGGSGGNKIVANITGGEFANIYGGSVGGSTGMAQALADAQAGKIDYVYTTELTFGGAAHVTGNVYCQSGKASTVGGFPVKATFNGGTIDGDLYGSGEANTSTVNSNATYNVSTITLEGVTVGGKYSAGSASSSTKNLLHENGTIHTIVKDGTVIKGNFVNGNASGSAAGLFKADIYGGTFSVFYGCGTGATSGGSYETTIHSAEADGDAATEPALKTNVYGVGYTNLSDTGKATFTIDGGTFTGGVFGRVSSRALTQGTTSFTINGGTFNGTVYGGALSAAIECDIETTINGGTFNGPVYGGSSTGSITGNVTTTINGGTFNDPVFGGTYNTGNITGNITNIITGGEFNGSYSTTYTNCFIGGSRVTDITGNVTNIISGGTFNNYASMGSHDVGASISGDVTNTISGDAVFNEYFFAGSNRGTIDGHIKTTINGAKMAQIVASTRGSSVRVNEENAADYPNHSVGEAANGVTCKVNNGVELIIDSVFSSKADKAIYGVGQYCEISLAENSEYNYAVSITINDMDYDGSIYVGSAGASAYPKAGGVSHGDVYLELNGGTILSTDGGRQVCLGNNNGGRIDGNVICQINGGTWNNFNLGSRVANSQQGTNAQGQPGHVEVTVNGGTVGRFRAYFATDLASSTIKVNPTSPVTITGATNNNIENRTLDAQISFVQGTSPISFTSGGGIRFDSVKGNVDVIGTEAWNPGQTYLIMPTDNIGTIQSVGNVLMKDGATTEAARYRGYAFGVTGRTIILGDTFGVRYVISDAMMEAFTSQLGGNYTVTYAIGAEGTPVEATLQHDESYGWYFIVNGIAAKDIDSAITVITVADVAPEAKDVFEDSIVKALTTVIEGESFSAEFKTAASAMLQYGQAAANYFFGENATQFDTVSGEVADYTGYTEVNHGTTAGEKVLVRGTSLILRDQMQLNFWIELDGTVYNDLNASNLKAVINGEEYDLVKNSGTAGYYTIAYGCNVKEMQNGIEVKIVDTTSGETVSNLFTDSVVSYCVTQQNNSNAKLATLVQKIMNYVYYANAYVDSI